jgi:thioredoxin-related protein
MARKLLILMFFFFTICVESQSLVWTNSMADAITLSNEKRKPLLILFTGTGVSENLNNEVFKTPDFEKWSRNNVILVRLDLSDAAASAETREQNLKLKNAFAVQELPAVCMASAYIRKGRTSFDSLGKVSYNSGGVKAWLSEANLILNPQ